MLFKKKQKGFSLIEVVISVSIFVIVSLACYKAFTQILILTRDLEAKSLGTMIVNEQFEILRNLPYTSVGIIGGIPSGVIDHVRNINRNGKQFEITTTIRNYDDPFDGTISGIPKDLSPADSKLVEVSVICTNCKNTVPSVFTGRIAPKSLETSSNNGALFVRVFDANGQPISGADVSIRSVSGSSILIEDTTDNSGLVQIIDIPTGAERYEVSVSKTGYSSDTTRAPSVGNPFPTNRHVTIVAQQVTQISFAIDELSTIAVSSKNLSCGSVGGIDFSIKGSKKIGLTPDVFKVDSAYVTNGSGQKDITDIEWDTYQLNLTDGAYDLAGTNPLLPLTILPGSVQDLSLYVVPKTSRNLLVIVNDDSTDLPLSGAEVKLEKSGYEDTLITDEGFTQQTDWSGPSGQQDFINETGYFDSDGSVDLDGPIGEVKLDKAGSLYVSDGELISSTIDIGGSTTPSFIRWKPTDQPALVGPEAVRFQIASSNTNTATTTWNYIGPGGSGTFYTTADQNISNSHSGKRYFRYKMMLSTEDNSVTPNISDVAITYTSECTPPGQVFFNGLEAGTYTLSVSKNGYQDFSTNISVTTSGQQTIVNLSQ